MPELHALIRRAGTACGLPESHVPISGGMTPSRPATSITKIEMRRRLKVLLAEMGWWLWKGGGVKRRAERRDRQRQGVSELVCMCSLLETD